MVEFKLEAKERNEKAKHIRNAGMIPAVIYGHNFDNISLAIDKIAFNRIFRDAGTSNLINLSIDEKKTFPVLIQDFQRDPINNDFVHIDLIKVNMKEEIETEIPLKFIGDAPAVLNLEGSLITPVDAVEVKCLPAALVPEFEVDLSGLDDFEKNIKISDIKIPEGIEILNDPEEIVAFVQEPRSEEELEALNEEVVEDVEAVEVEEKGKEEEGEEGETGQPTEEKKAE